jgi:hypothetical protein
MKSPSLSLLFARLLAKTALHHPRQLELDARKKLISHGEAQR